jgi:hypothetical protein
MTRTFLLTNQQRPQPPTEMIFSHALNVYDLDSDAEFGVLQSRIHEVWARLLGSSMKDDLRYTPSDCFATFPFPDFTFDGCGSLGHDYFIYRRDVMVDAGEGLTKVYNRFHDPHDTSNEIARLRNLHDELDGAVLRGYGWADLADKASCEFLLDYEEEEDDDPTAKKSKKKKPWRYRWPDGFRDEVLARLLELNEQRAAEEKLAGKTAEAKAKSYAAKPRGRKPATTKKQEPGLFKE